MREAYKGKKEIDLSNSLILAGADVCLLSETLLRSYTDKISQKLAKHKNTMIQYLSEQLYKAMMENRAIVAIDITTNDLIGFGQLWDYEKGKKEFGSWISYVPGIGKPVLMAGSSLGYETDPNAQIIAIVEQSNLAPQTSIRNIGGVQIGHKTSDRVFNQNSLQPAQMEIFDISIPQLDPGTRNRNLKELREKQLRKLALAS